MVVKEKDVQIAFRLEENERFVMKFEKRVAAFKQELSELTEFRFPYKFAVSTLVQKVKSKGFSASQLTFVKERVRQGFAEKKSMQDVTDYIID